MVGSGIQVSLGLILDDIAFAIFTPGTDVRHIDELTCLHFLFGHRTYHFTASRL